jgi:hypothetical protein
MPLLTAFVFLGFFRFLLQLDNKVRVNLTHLIVQMIVQTDVRLDRDRERDVDGSVHGVDRKGGSVDRGPLCARPAWFHDRSTRPESPFVTPL